MIVVAAGAIGLIVFVSFIAARLVRARTAGMSIRMQVFLALALIVGAFAFGLGLMVLDRVKARADLVAQQAAESEANTVAALVASELKAGTTLHEVAHTLERGAPEGGKLDIALYDADARPIMELGRPPHSQGTVAITVPILRDGKTVGHVRVVKPTLVIQQTLADFAPTVLIISLLLGAVAAGSSALIGRTIATPIEALTAFAEQVSEGDRRVTPPQGHGREVKRLSYAIDSMRRQLEGRPFVETFAADLSHELKNPVAAIRASAEVLSDGAIEEPDEAANFIARILESTKRIEALLDDLLSLAELEARGVSEASTIDLRSQAERAATEAREHGAEIALTCTGKLKVRGDAAWLARAIANLIDNGRVHGEGGAIEVQLEQTDNEVICIVRNDGKVSRGVHKRLFKRFVTTRADRGGTGLGLPIVRAIAEAHGGQIRCDELGPPSVEFRLTLPSA